MVSSSCEEYFPIRVLSEQTGVGSSTLRAWERRYGLLKPNRTPKGHRLYCRDDVQRVERIINLLSDGHSLRTIKNLLSASDGGDIATEAISRNNTGATTPEGMPTIWQNYLRGTMKAVSEFSVERIDAIYNEASSLYPVDMVTDKLIQPALETLGEAWKKAPDHGIAEEHFYTSWLKNRLGARFHHAYSQARGTRIICACMPGCYHEIGLMLFSLSALARGYRVLYFGANLPLNQLTHIVQKSAARAIVMALHEPLDTAANNELSRLLPELQTPLFIGGSYQPPDMDTLQPGNPVMLGARIGVAMRVFESHVPVYPKA